MQPDHCYQHYRYYSDHHVFHARCRCGLIERTPCNRHHDFACFCLQRSVVLFNHDNGNDKHYDHYMRMCVVIITIDIIVTTIGITLRAFSYSNQIQYTIIQYGMI